jgi:hypothetical protein
MIQLWEVGSQLVREEEGKRLINFANLLTGGTLSPSYVFISLINLQR